MDEFGDVREYVYILSGDTVIGEQVYYCDFPDYSLVYLYDEAGSPIGLKYRYDEPGAAYSVGVYDCYFFEKNLQGDIIGIYDRYGTKVVTYTYDAWGNMTVSGSMADSIGTYNPFRYRGYYYDTDTGLYYLQSRYYNPIWGRFINGDTVVSGIGGDLRGYSIFTYSFNNPVNMSDSSGDWPEWVEKSANWVNDNVIQPVESFVKDVVEDAKNCEFNNQSEEKVLESNYFSFYKGVPVIRTNGDRSGCFGAIFLTRETNNRTNPKDVVRHEYGHTKQLAQLGPVKYLIAIGIPSIFNDKEGMDYYREPYEITADIYGGVISRIHYQSDIDAGFKYLDRIKKIKPIGLIA